MIPRTILQLLVRKLFANEPVSINFFTKPTMKTLAQCVIPLNDIKDVVLVSLLLFWTTSL